MRMMWHIIIIIIIIIIDYASIEQPCIAFK